MYPFIWILLFLFSRNVFGLTLTVDLFPKELKENPKEVIATSVQVAPVIDGTLNDSAWDSAAKMAGFWVAGKDESAKNQTVAWVCYDDENIYFAFACIDPRVGLEKIPKDSPSAWQNDCVEIFLSPTGEKEQWYHFILTSGGSQWDDCSDPKYRATSRFGESWDAPWTGATQKTDFGWTAEIKIPFSSMFDTSKYRVVPGWIWRMKLTREDYNPGISEPEFSSYSKIGALFQDILAGLDLIFTTRNFITNPEGKILDKTGQITGWHYYVPAGGKGNMRHVSDSDPVEFTFENADNATIFFGPIKYAPFPASRTVILSAEMKMEAKPDSKSSAVIRYKNPEGKFIQGEGPSGKLRIFPDNEYHVYQIAFPVAAGFAPLHIDISAALYGETVRFYIKSVKLEFGSLVFAEGNDWCLTGNAMGPLSLRNKKIEGCYTYFDAGTDTYFFPRDKKHVSEENIRNDWVPFSEGKLTDGNLSTGVGWPNLWTGSNGIDVVFDLGDFYNVSRVEILSGYDSVAGGQLYVKGPQDLIFVLVDSVFDRVDATKGGPQKKTNHLILKANGSTTRFVRLQFLCSSYNGPAEIQIWGNKMDGRIVPPVAYLQQKGKIVIQNPKEIPLEQGMDTPFLPVPQRFKYGKKEIVLDPSFKIIISPDSTERTKETSDVLKEELFLSTGQNFQKDLFRGSYNTDAQVIFLGICSDRKFLTDVRKIFKDFPAVVEKPEGYVLVAQDKKILVLGADEPGLFCGCMSLLELLKMKNGEWVIPEITISDWPECPYRMMQVRPAPEANLLRALARYKINYVEFAYRYNKKIVELSKMAERYFIKTILGADPRIVLNLTTDPEIIEKSPEEKIEDLGFGRRNICPSNPKTWELYFKELDQWIDHFTGFLNINFDEMYQTPNGSRWNVCQLCRAKNKHSYEILADAINTLHRYAAKHKLKLLMLDTCFMGRSISNPDDNDPDWRKALDIIPKDIVMAVWHPADVNELFFSKGFTQVYLSLTGGNWKKRNFPGKYYSGVLWYGLDSLFKVPFVLQESQACWSPGKALPGAGDPIDVNINEISLHWEEIVNGSIYPSRIASSKDYFFVDISSVANNSFTDEKPFDGKGWIDFGPNFDLKAMVPGEKMFNGVPFKIIDEKKNNGKSCITVHNRGYVDRTFPFRVEIPVPDKKLISLNFLHTLDNRPGHNYLRKNELAGYYFVVYSDGYYIPVELKYAVNIANWDGLPCWSYYEPREKSMKGGILCWRGETQSGIEANLYRTEWINPRPDVPITKIIFSPCWKKSCMNPTLLAITGIEYSEKLKNYVKKIPTETTLKNVDKLNPAFTRGTAIELKGGVLHNDLFYETREKISIRASSVFNNSYREAVLGGEDFKSDVSCIISDSNDFLRFAGKGDVTFSFPEKEILSGVLVSGSYRDERKGEDFPPQKLDLTLYISYDGNNFEKHREISDYTPEEEGPKWIEFPEKPIKSFKVEVKAMSPYSMPGLNLVQPYRP